MPTVEVSFTALPAHVRTARLVALAVARRAGVADELLDEVRLAVGEACSRAVAVQAERAPDVPVTMLLSDDRDRFTVEVTDVGPLEGEPGDVGEGALDPAVVTRTDGSVPGADPEAGPEALPPGFGLAVISGLVEDVAVTSDVSGTHVAMTWPAADSAGSTGSAGAVDPEALAVADGSDVGPG